ncbi:MAG: DnaA ATPase domain-containing protein, partial [Actinomycetota bacterium]
MEKGTTDTKDPRADAIWARTVERLREEVPAGTFNMWFAEIRADAVGNHTLELLAPSEYVRAWLSRNYLELITRLVAQASGESLDVALTVEPTSHSEAAEVDESPPPSPERPSAPVSSFPTRYTFDNFVLGASNRFAHAAAMAVAEAPPSRAYNPLFIYGGVGLGKTHLLYAIANHM